MLCEKNVKIKLFGINIANWPIIVQFLSLCFATFASFLIYGYVMELIYLNPKIKFFSWYLTFMQFIIYSTFSFTKMKLTNTFTRKIPLKIYFQLAFFTVITMGFSNQSVVYLNYPTQVIFKCCKLIPVLIGGILIQGKKYNIYDFSAAILMSVGLVLFSLVDSKISPNFDIRGYILISLALTADAVIGNLQEKQMHIYKASNTEMIFFSYAIGSMYIFLFILIKGELFTAFVYFFYNPIETYGYNIILSVVGFVGIDIVLTLIRLYGAFVAVTVTTLRKAITICLSFYFFSKPFSINYVWSELLILLGIYLNVYSKNQNKIKKKISNFILFKNKYCLNFISCKLESIRVM